MFNVLAYVNVYLSVDRRRLSLSIFVLIIYIHLRPYALLEDRPMFDDHISRLQLAFQVDPILERCESLRREMGMNLLSM